MSVTMKTEFCSCWDESPQTKSLSLNAVNLGGVWPDMSSDCVMSYSSALFNLTMLERVRAVLPTFCRPHKMGGHPHAHGLNVWLEMQKRFQCWSCLLLTESL